MKVAVIGANGQLGSDIFKKFKDNSDEVVQLNHNTFDVSNLKLITSTLMSINPDLVINTSAMHNVEKCEESPVQAFRVNGLGAFYLAKIANQLRYTLMHVSTDYVYDGNKKAPYVESDCPNPLNVYGNTKLAGEFFIRNITKRHFIFRVSGLYGNNPCRAKGGINFVSLMLKLAKERKEIRVVDDEVLTPTYTEDIASQILHLATCDNYGLYHLTAQDCCSWHEFAQKIFELKNVSVRLSVADPNEFPSKVQRPKYSVLENKKLKSIGMDIMPHWTEGLKNYLGSRFSESGHINMI